MMTHRGNATLISLLIMGALLTLGMGVNALLLRDIRTTGDRVLSGKAYYAAEAAAEEGLLAVSRHAAGFTDTVSGTLDALTRYSYTVSSLGETIPEGENTYLTLAPQATMSLPLFQETANGIQTIDRFQIFLYMQQAAASDAMLSGGNVLRWKVVGTKQIGAETVTEAISDYVSVEPIHIVRGDIVPQHPQRFDDMYLAKYKPYKAVFQVFYSIHQFLQEHQNNYLLLTNVADTAMTGGAASLHIRMVSGALPGAQQLVSPQATIHADGHFRTFAQSLDVRVLLDQFLPVFNFALYRTAEVE